MKHFLFAALMLCSTALFAQTSVNKEKTPPSYKVQKIKMNICTSWQTAGPLCACTGCQCYDITYTTTGGVISGIVGYTALPASSCSGANACQGNTAPACWGSMRVQDVQAYVDQHPEQVEDGLNSAKSPEFVKYPGKMFKAEKK